MEDIGNTEQFEQMAACYDSPERNRIATIIAETMRASWEWASDLRRWTFGCGTGLVGLNIHAEFHELVFVDWSLAMLKQVEEKLEQMALPIKARTLQIDLEREAAEQEHFSCILMSQVLLNIKDYPSVLLSLPAYWKQAVSY